MNSTTNGYFLFDNLIAPNNEWSYSIFMEKVDRFQNDQGFNLQKEPWWINPFYSKVACTPYIIIFWTFSGKPWNIDLSNMKILKYLLFL